MFLAGEATFLRTRVVERQEDLAVGVLAQRGGDLLGELLDLLDQWLDRCDQGEHERSAGGELGLADASLGRASEL